MRPSRNNLSRMNNSSGNDGQVMRRHRPDYWLAVVATLLVAIGIILMYSISPALAVQDESSPGYFFSRHLLAAAIGLIGTIFIYHMPLKHLKLLVYPMLIISIVSVLAILAIDGLAYRWLQVAGFSFQPAELMKFTLVIWLAFFVTEKKLKGDDLGLKDTIKPITYVLVGLAVMVVIIQRDLGSMLVIITIALCVLLVAGLRLRTFAMITLVVITLGTLAIVSTPYRLSRLDTFLNPAQDCLNEGYHACQAMISIGSGGLFGLGVGNSVQAYGYLPETPTDSIFAIYSEKFGFIGNVLLIGLICVLIIRTLTIAQRTTSWEARLVTIGIIAWIASQSIINIGAMIGLLPLKGITLPFISYGGSSLIFVMLSMGVLMRISCYTSNRKYDIESNQEGFYENNASGRRNSRPRYTITRRSS